jgi:hypothetical protein
MTSSSSLIRLALCNFVAGEYAATARYLTLASHQPDFDRFTSRLGEVDFSSSLPLDLQLDKHLAFRPVSLSAAATDQEDWEDDPYYKAAPVHAPPHVNDEFDHLPGHNFAPDVNDMPVMVDLSGDPTIGPLRYVGYFEGEGDDLDHSVDDDAGTSYNNSNVSVWDSPDNGKTDTDIEPQNVADGGNDTGDDSPDSSSDDSSSGDDSEDEDEGAEDENSDDEEGSDEDTGEE